MSTGWRLLALMALMALPVWAALDGTHRTAYLPAAVEAIMFDAAALGAEVVAEVAPAEPHGLMSFLSAAQAPTPAPAAAPTPFPPFPPLVARWRELVEAELGALRATRAVSETITPELVLAVIAAESGGDPDARSHAHAAGLMQVLPTTLASLLTESPTPSPFDPTANVRAGILYLNEAVRSHGGDLSWALAAYNGGIPSTLRARSSGAPPLSESSAFAARVLAAVSSAG